MNKMLLPKKVLLVLLLTITTHVAKALNETEPNNSTATANLTFQDSTMSGNTSVVDANDYFISLPNDDGTITVKFNFTAALASNHFYVYVYNKNGSQIASKIMYTVGSAPVSDSLKVFCRQADSTYFRISTSGAFTYSLLYETKSSGVSDAAPNNTLLTAQPVLANDTIRGRIGYTGVATDDNDYFVTTLPIYGTMRYRVWYDNTSNSTGSHFYTYIYNKNGSQIGNSIRYSQPLGVTADSISLYCREQDTVYIRISSSGCFSYKIYYEAQAPPTNDQEPNNSLATAQLITSNTPVGGRIGYTSVQSDDNDYFVTVLPTFGTLKYTVAYNNTSNSTGSHFYSYIYNKNGSQIGSSIKYSQPLGISYDTINIYCRELDTVYFRVSSSGCFSYTFQYEIAAAAISDVEPNNSFATAQAFLPNDTLNGRIGYLSLASDDNDYFWTVLPEDGTIKYHVEYDNTSNSAGSHFYSYIYNKNESQIGNSINYSQPLGISYDSITINCRAKDTVYFRISSSGCFGYKIYYEIDSPTPPDSTNNNTIATAQWVNYSDTTFGRIGYTSVATDANDYYATLLPDDGTLQYIVEYTNTSGSTGSHFYTYIYNKNGSLIGNSIKYSQPIGTVIDTVTITCRQADTVFLRTSSSGCFSYKFYQNILPSGQADVEPNNTTALTTPINLNNTLEGRIGYVSTQTDANDYFKFYNPGYSTITTYLSYNNTSGSAGSHFYLYLYKSSGAQVFSSFNYSQAPGLHQDTLVMACLPADTFYLRVSSSGCFSYEMDFEVEDQQPVVDIKYSRFGNQFAFMPESKNTNELFWDFGDGSDTAIAYPKKEFGIGVFDVVLRGKNQSCNLVVYDTVSIVVPGIEYYTPHQAATDILVGYFAIRIFGGGFDSTATLELIGTNGTVIPERLGVPSQKEMNALFNFKDAAFGKYDVKITLGNGDVHNFPAGFEIITDEPGIKITTKIVGPSRIRTNRETPYTLNVTNHRKKMASGVFVGVVLPRGVKTDLAKTIRKRTGSITLKGSLWDELTIDRQSFSDTYFEGQFNPNVDTMTVNLDSLYANVDSIISVDIDSLYGEARVATLHFIYLPFIFGESTAKISFKVLSPQNQGMDFLSYAWVFTMRQNPMSPQALDWVHEGGMQAAALAEYAPNPALKAVGKSAGWIDIGSKILFAEGFDLWYGTNVADEEFYASQSISAVAEVAGGKTSYGDKYKRANTKIKEAKLGIKRNSEYRSHLLESISTDRKIPKVYKEELLDHLKSTTEHLAKLDKRLSFAEKQKLINGTKEYLAKRLINLSDKAIQELLFGDPKTNEPDEMDNNRINSVTSFDPNELYGVNGPTVKNYIKSESKLTYYASYENVDTALAPAQIVRIEVALDSTLLDYSTFEIGDFGFGGKTYFVEPNRSTYFKEIDLRPDMDIIVRMNTFIDSASSKLICQLTSLDPITGDLLIDPDAGFLPPNVNFPEGEGFITFNFNPKPKVAHNDSIKLTANIFFDENAPIQTNTWINIVDELPPTSSILNLEVKDDSIIVLTYAGNDNESGVYSYRVMVNVNNEGWLSSGGFAVPSNGKAEFLGILGTHYQFYIEAIDSVGNREKKAITPEVEVQLANPESPWNPEFTLYPNPYAYINMLKIKANGSFANTDVTIYNTFAQAVYSFNYDFKNQIEAEVSIPKLAAGAYFVHFKTGSGKTNVQKLLIIR